MSDGEARAEQERLAGLLERASTIVFLTGAGMSTESGIRDFRSAQGLYAAGIGEEVFDIDLFTRNPEHFYRFAAGLYEELYAALPNAGHRAITELASRLGKEVYVCTQNIDTLHQDAGNPNVSALHGSVTHSQCLTCGYQVTSRSLWPTVKRGLVPRHSGCGGVFKPEIVFYGEMLPGGAMDASCTAIAGADLLIIAGTSLAVFPAAQLPAQRSADCLLAIINHGSTPLDKQADLVSRQSIGACLSEAVRMLVHGI